MADGQRSEPPTDRTSRAFEEVRDVADELRNFARVSHAVVEDAVGQARLTWQEREAWANRQADRLLQLVEEQPEDDAEVLAEEYRKGWEAGEAEPQQAAHQPERETWTVWICSCGEVLNQGSDHYTGDPGHVRREVEVVPAGHQPEGEPSAGAVSAAQVAYFEDSMEPASTLMRKAIRAAYVIDHPQDREAK